MANEVDPALPEAVIPGDVPGAPPPANVVPIQMDNNLFLSQSDHPGMVLVSHPLVGVNYSSWKKSMLLAFGAKSKTGFITGKVPPPPEDDPTFELWKKIDCMLISWILNSLSKDIVEAFVYANSAQELWDDIAQRFGESNGPLMYQIQREITSVSQGNDSVQTYFTRLKKLWDQFSSLSPLPVCNCPTGKHVLDSDAQMKLIQFLMGLNESLDHVRNQILLMEPLPHVNKAYSMVMMVEKQRAVHVSFPDTQDMAMIAKSGPNNSSFKFQNTGNRNRMNTRKTKEDRARMVCSHCGGKRHDVSECFQLNGVPEWYKRLQEQKGRQSANAVGTSQESQTGTENQAASVDFSVMFQQEFAKYMAHNKAPSYTSDQSVDFAHSVHFAGPEE